MFDDLRQQVNAEPEKPQAEPAPQKAVAAAPKPRRRPRKILGMTGPQRFTISVMLMLMVCMMGFMLLFVTGKVGF